MSGLSSGDAHLLVALSADVAAGCWPVIWRVFLTCGALVALAGISWWAGESAWQRWQRRRRNPLGLEAGDCERCITSRTTLPCACDAFCSEPACLAFTITPAAERAYADMAAQLRRDIEEGLFHE